MKGMWTKHVTSEGKVFYFNAYLEKSVWNPPSDCLVHEAANISPINFDLVEENKSPVENLSYSQSDSNTLISESFKQISDDIPQVPQQMNPSSTQDLIQERMKHALSSLQNKSKRPKTSNESLEEVDPLAKEYLRQKSELEASAGASGDIGSKWLVR